MSYACICTSVVAPVIYHCSIAHVNFGMIFYCIGNSQLCIYMYNPHSKSDWLFNTQSDWLILENVEKANLNINMPYCPFIIIHVVILAHESLPEL